MTVRIWNNPNNSNQRKFSKRLEVSRTRLLN